MPYGSILPLKGIILNAQWLKFIPFDQLFAQLGIIFVIS